MNLEQQFVLDTIAQGESPDYNTIYGGHKFSSTKDHPRVHVKLDDGQYSSAAGRYQLLAPTWDRQAKRLGLQDFSPASQDAAAWDLANRTYQQKTGRNLEADAASRQVDWKALVHQWPSLERLTPAAAAGPQATQAPAATPWVPPSLPANFSRFLSNGPNELGLEARPQMTLPPQLLGGLLHGHEALPVDHDPWASQQPRLIPVDHDPFQKEASK